MSTDRQSRAVPAISYRYCPFPSTVIQHAVWLYARFSPGFRDVADLLAKRGIIISYKTIRFIRAAKWQNSRR